MKRLIMTSFIILTLLCILTGCSGLEFSPKNLIKTSNSIIEETTTIISSDDIFVNLVSTKLNKNSNQQIKISSNKNKRIIKSHRIKKSKRAKKKKKNKTKHYTSKQLYLLSHLIYAEAGNCSNELQLGVGSVVLNRVESSKFPNTIKGVIYQSGQYSCIWDGNFNKKPNKQSIKNAIYLLKNGSQLPKYVVFQAEFAQGRGIYKRVGNTYFCY